MVAETPSLSLQHELACELVKSERLRLTILVVVLVVFTGAFLVVNRLELGVIHDPFAPLRLLVVAVPAAMYFLWRRWRLGRFLEVGQMPPTRTRYITATVEAIIPTSILVVQQESVDPLLALGMPTSYAYFLLIAMATLHLSFWLCLYSGITCAALYIVVALLVIDQRLPEGATTSPVPLHWWKAALMVTTGLSTGLVAQRVRKGIENSIRSVESRRRILDVFGKYVSPQVVEHLLAWDVALGGETRRVCVMFLDIRNFTAFSSSKPPEQVVVYLNSLFDFMIDSTNRHGGIVNKFLGDGFMAIFGAPVSDGHDCQHAVAAAREILDRLARLNSSQEAPPTRIGIALHVGDVVAGSIGSAQRREYTIIGDTVNLASRIEALNKEFQSQLLVSEAVWQEIGDLPGAKCRGPVAIRGREEPVNLYELA